MPTFEPFAGLRYPPTDLTVLDDLVCPPYDVISEPERLELENRHPHNIVRVELPRGADAYANAAALVDQWQQQGVLRTDPAPAFYGYRMTYPDQAGNARRTVGVIGALGIELLGSGVLPHEETTPKAKTDRLELIRATRANLSPIWGLTPASISAHLDSPEKPEQRATDPDGVLHEIWAITDAAAIAGISEAVASQPVLIADGHHRYECALAYRDEAGPDAAGAGAVMALVVELTRQLHVGAIHRLVSWSDGDGELGGLSEWFDLETAPSATRQHEPNPDGPGIIVLTRDSSLLARPRPTLDQESGRDLDSARMQVVLASLPAHEVTYQHGWSACAEAVATGQADVAFGLRPPSLAQIEQIAHGGSRMPAKTTYFWPKPRTGMVVRQL